MSMLGLSLMFVFFHKSWFLSWSRLRTPVFLKLDRCTLTAVMQMYRRHMFVDWRVVLISAMIHELMCSNIHVYVYVSSICIFCAIMLNNIS